MTAINHISIKDTFWCKIEEYLISFGYKQLPSSVHFTIAFNKESKDVNFHITKNIGEKTLKPKIEIVRIDKNILRQVYPKLLKLAIRRMLATIDLEELQERNK